MNSSRLPGKVMTKFSGVSVICHVVNRVKLARTVSKVYVATTVHPSDQQLIKHCVDHNFNIFVGSENDVLDRYYQLAKLEMPDNIVRITADCPVIDPSVIDMVVENHLNSGADYTSNTMINPYPDGQDVEVFKFASLERAWRAAELKSDREHVTPYIKFGKENFSTNFIEGPAELSKLRMTLDEPEDFEMLSCLFEKLYEKDNYFSLSEIIECVKNYPHITSINGHFLREEGYRKSLERD